MSEYGMQSFCSDCGAHRRRMPFGEDRAFFDSGPCSRCGSFTSHREVARRERVGRWPWQRGWVNREGKRADQSSEESQP
jgi:hypothetical protein